MRCKILLDDKKIQQSHGIEIEDTHNDSRLEKANAVIDIMSSALVLQINETDRINILKVIAQELYPLNRSYPWCFHFKGGRM